MRKTNTNTARESLRPRVLEGLYPNEPGFVPEKMPVVGGVVPAADPVVYNTGRQTVRLTVRNTGDRPIQVGSHFHFFEVNRYLEFDRDAAFGCHLNIPATTAIRFEPGDQKEVEVVAYAGKRRVIGFNGLVMGYTGDEDAPTYFPARMRALRRVRAMGFKIAGGSGASGLPASCGCTTADDAPDAPQPQAEPRTSTRKTTKSNQKR